MDKGLDGWVQGIQVGWTQCCSLDVFKNNNFGCKVSFHVKTAARFESQQRHEEKRRGEKENHVGGGNAQDDGGGGESKRA